MANLNRGFVFLCTLTALLVSTSGSSADDSLQQQLLDRIEALEKQGQDQMSLIKTQAELLKRVESKLEDQAERLVSQEYTLRKYIGRVKQLERAIVKLKLHKYRQDPVTHDKHDNSDTDFVGEKQFSSSAVSKELHTQKRVLLNAEGPVAFHATIKPDGDVLHIGVGQKIVFPDVMINLGAGYHNLHGLFTAPQPGIYIFSTSIMAHDSGHPEIWVHIIQNGNSLANAYARGDSGRMDQGSVTVVTQLAVGDEVWVSVKGPADTTLFGGGYVSFMGCLVFPL